jgi:transposase
VSEFYEGRQFVGMDLHRRRSVLVRMSETGEHLETVRILNDRDVLAEVMSRAGESPEAVLEATYGWYWAADALAELGATVHLAHPLGVKAFSYRRVKNDLLTELSVSSRRGCVPGGVRLARFAAREQRCGCAAGVVRAGGAAAGFAGGDGRAVRAVSAC